MSKPLPIPTGIRSSLPDIFSKLLSSFNTDPQPAPAITFDVALPAEAQLKIQGSTATLKMSRPPINRGYLIYHPLTYHPVVEPPGAVYKIDTFDDRVVTDLDAGFGTASDGITEWTMPDGSPYVLVNSGEGLLHLDPWGGVRGGIFGDSFPSSDVNVRIKFRFITDQTIFTVRFRSTDVYSGYTSALQITYDGGFMSFYYSDYNQDDSSNSDFGSLNTVSGDLGDYFWLYLRRDGQTTYWKVWADGDTEPVDWLDQYDTPTTPMPASAWAVQVGAYSWGSTDTDAIGIDYIEAANVLRNDTPDVDVYHWTPTTISSTVWSPTSNYAAGAYVTYFGDTYRCIEAVSTDPIPIITLAEDDFHRPDQAGWGTSSDGREWFTNGIEGNISILDNKALIQYNSGGFVTSSRRWIQFGDTPVADTEFHDVVIKWYYTLHDGVPGSWNIGWVTNLNGENLIGTGLFFPHFNAPALDGVEDDLWTELDLYGYGYDTFPSAPSTAPLTNNVEYYTRVRASRPEFSVRTWVATDPEPTSWDLVLDSTGHTLDPIDNHFMIILPYYFSPRNNQQLFFTHVGVYTLPGAEPPSPPDDVVHWQLVDEWNPYSSYPALSTVSYLGTFYTITSVPSAPPDVVPGTLRSGPTETKEVRMSLATATYMDLTDHKEKQAIPSIGQLAPIDIAGTVLPSFEQWLRDNLTEFLPTDLITWSVDVNIDAAPIAALALVET